MSKEMTVIVLGLFVVVVPFLGIPGEWRTILLVLSGAGLSVTGFILRGELLARGLRPHEHHPFVESNTPQHTAQHHHDHHEGQDSFN